MSAVADITLTNDRTATLRRVATKLTGEFVDCRVINGGVSGILTAVQDDGIVLWSSRWGHRVTAWDKIRGFEISADIGGYAAGELAAYEAENPRLFH